MMIMVLLGTSRIQQQAIVDDLADARDMEGFSVRHVDNNPNHNDADRKLRNLTTFLTGKNYRDTVTIVTGISSLVEFDLLNSYGATFCILPGIHPAFLTGGEVNITDDFLHVALAPQKLAALTRRRIHISPLEAFSECYMRERNRGK